MMASRNEDGSRRLLLRQSALRFSSAFGIKSLERRGSEAVSQAGVQATISTLRSKTQALTRPLRLNNRNMSTARNTDLSELRQVKPRGTQQQRNKSLLCRQVFSLRCVEAKRVRSPSATLLNPATRHRVASCERFAGVLALLRRRTGCRRRTTACLLLLRRSEHRHVVGRFKDGALHSVLDPRSVKESARRSKVVANAT
jgi:hypothetical protein